VRTQPDGVELVELRRGHHAEGAERAVDRPVGLDHRVAAVGRGALVA
jgi:hypothetical protein